MAEDTKRLTILLEKELFKTIKRMSFEQEKPMSEFIKKWIDKGISGKGNCLQDNSSKKESFRAISDSTEPRFLLVDVKSIKPMPGKPKMTSDRIESAAKSIIEIGLIKPLMLKQTSVDEYECLSTADELGAVRRAQELDPAKCEMVNAMVIPSGLVETVKKQISMFSSMVESSTWPKL